MKKQQFPLRNDKASLRGCTQPKQSSIQYSLDCFGRLRPRNDEKSEVEDGLVLTNNALFWLLIQNSG